GRGREEGLRAERAAHRGGDDRDAFLGEVEHARQLLAQVEGRLRAGVALQPTAVPAGDARVRLHVRVLGAGDAEGLLDDDVGRREPGVDVAVADAEAVADVRPGLGPQAEVRGAARGDIVLLVDEGRAYASGPEHVRAGRQPLV